VEAGHERAATHSAYISETAKDARSSWDNTATVTAPCCKEASKTAPVNGGDDGQAIASQGGICGQAMVQAQEATFESIVFTERVTRERKTYVVRINQSVCQSLSR